MFPLILVRQSRPNRILVRHGIRVPGDPGVASVDHRSKCSDFDECDSVGRRIVLRKRWPSRGCIPAGSRAPHCR
jgi:hypothetical protein